MLMGSQNRDLFVIAVEYLILLRIFMPDMTTDIVVVISRLGLLGEVAGRGRGTDELLIC